MRFDVVALEWWFDKNYRWIMESPNEAMDWLIKAGASASVVAYARALAAVFGAKAGAGEKMASPLEEWRAGALECDSSVSTGQSSRLVPNRV